MESKNLNAEFKNKNEFINLMESLNGFYFKFLGFDDNKVSFGIEDLENKIDNQKFIISFAENQFDEPFPVSFHFKNKKIKGSCYDFTDIAQILKKEKIKLEKFYINSFDLILYFDIDKKKIKKKDSTLVLQIYEPKNIELINC